MRVGDVDLGDIYIEMIVKPMGVDEITESVQIEKEKNQATSSSEIKQRRRKC